MTKDILNFMAYRVIKSTEEDLWVVRKGTAIIDKNDERLLDVFILGKLLFEKEALVVDEDTFYKDRSYN